MKFKMTKMTKNGTQNRALCPGYVPRTKIFGLREVPGPMPSFPEKIVKIQDFDVNKVVLFVGILC